MNNYCFEECPIGKEYKKQVLEKNDSVFDAIYDYENLINTCRFVCNKNKKENKKEEDL